MDGNDAALKDAARGDAARGFETITFGGGERPEEPVRKDGKFQYPDPLFVAVRKFEHSQDLADALRKSHPMLPESELVGSVVLGNGFEFEVFLKAFAPEGGPLERFLVIRDLRHNMLATDAPSAEELRFLGNWDSHTESERSKFVSGKLEGEFRNAKAWWTMSHAFQWLGSDLKGDEWKHGNFLCIANTEEAMQRQADLFKIADEGSRSGVEVMARGDDQTFNGVRRGVIQYRLELGTGGGKRTFELQIILGAPYERGRRLGGEYSPLAFIVFDMDADVEPEDLLSERIDFGLESSLFGVDEPLTLFGHGISEPLAPELLAALNPEKRLGIVRIQRNQTVAVFRVDKERDGKETPHLAIADMWNNSIAFAPLDEDWKLAAFKDWENRDGIERRAFLLKLAGREIERMAMNGVWRYVEKKGIAPEGRIGNMVRVDNPDLSPYLREIAELLKNAGQSDGTLSMDGRLAIELQVPWRAHGMDTALDVRMVSNADGGMEMILIHDRKIGRERLAGRIDYRGMGFDSEWIAKYIEGMD